MSKAKTVGGVHTNSFRKIKEGKKAFIKDIKNKTYGRL